MSHIKERPILMSAPMVLSTLLDLKTNTRRLKDLEEINECPNEWTLDNCDDGYAWFKRSGENWTEDSLIPCPYGGIGDRLWIRETIWQWGRWCDAGKTKTGRQKRKFVPVGKHVTHVADCPEYPAEAPPRNIIHADEQWIKRPAIFCPRWASRITLEITDIRVERLQDISSEDAIAEGMEHCTTEEGRRYAFKDYLDEGYYYSDPIPSFKTLWKSINGADSWNLNPWVWAIAFKRIEGAS